MHAGEESTWTAIPAGGETDGWLSLSVAWVAGAVAAAAVILLAVIIVPIFIICRRRRKSSRRSAGNLFTAGCHVQCPLNKHQLQSLDTVINRACIWNSLIRLMYRLWNGVKINSTLHCAALHRSVVDAKFLCKFCCSIYVAVAYRCYFHSGFTLCWHYIVFSFTVLLLFLLFFCYGELRFSQYIGVPVRTFLRVVTLLCIAYGFMQNFTIMGCSWSHRILFYR